MVAELIELVLPVDVPPGRRATDAAGYKPLPPLIRDSLFVGIASDTGWFRFSNTTPATHELAARLMRQGADQATLYQQVEQSERPEKLALMIRAVSNLELLADSRAAMMVLRRRDFEQTGALMEETERLIDIPQQIGSIRLIVLISETVDRTNGREQIQTRMSFRSKPPLDGEAVNVAELAGRFGGGGHARAAGARCDGPADELIPQIRAALEKAVGSPSQA